jgi:hypothetical protein
MVLQDLENAPVSDKMKVLLEIAKNVQISGKRVSPSSIEKAKALGATDLEIHDTVLIAALFCLYNKYVDGLASITPNDPAFYQTLGNKIVQSGISQIPAIN